MKMIVKIEELNGVINKIDSDNTSIKEKLDELRKQIIELKDIWEGQASDIFTNKANNYINFLDSVPTIINDLSSVMKKASLSYKKLDEGYAEQMKKAVVKHE